MVRVAVGEAGPPPPPPPPPHTHRSELIQLSADRSITGSRVLSACCSSCVKVWKISHLVGVDGLVSGLGLRAGVGVWGFGIGEGSGLVIRVRVLVGFVYRFGFVVGGSGSG